MNLFKRLFPKKKEISLDEQYGRIGEEFAKKTEIIQRENEIENQLILKFNQANELEKTDPARAITLYVQLITARYRHPGPYERLRIIYTRQKRYHDAIRVCQLFIDTNDNYPEQAQKFQQWIEKLEAKI